MNEFSFWFLSRKNTNFTNCSFYDNAFLILKLAKLSNQLCCKFEALICISREESMIFWGTLKTSCQVTAMNLADYKRQNASQFRSFIADQTDFFAIQKRIYNPLVKSDDRNISKSSQNCQLNTVPQWMNECVSTQEFCTLKSSAVAKINKNFVFLENFSAISLFLFTTKVCLHF